MKKKKAVPPPRRDFRNNPFKPLKDLPREAASSRRQIAQQAELVKPANDDDDASLFLRSVAGAKRIGPVQGNTDTPPALPRRHGPDADKPDDSRIFLDAMQKIGATFREHGRDITEPEEEAAGSRSPSSRMKQLKRGSIRVSEELDLHGYLKDEAIRRLDHFIRAASARQRTAVLVITGKGINSPEGPVLQGAVADWLRREGKALVAEFHPAPRDRGGSGAFVVFLKNR